MAKSLEEALKKAGVKREQFKRPVSMQQQKKEEDKGQEKEEEVDFVQHMKRRRVVYVPEKRARIPVAYTSSDKKIVTVKPQPSAPPAQVKLSSDLGRYLAKLEGVYGDSKEKKKASDTKSKAPPVLQILGAIFPNPLLVTNDLLESHVISPGNDGISTQLANAGTESDEFDITIGIDFGTSTTKAVVRDNIGRAFAVPFLPHDTNNPYLLPSRVFESRDAYQLEKNGFAHRTLKLSVIDRDARTQDYVRAVAFLALVIRYCRGWLLATKAEIYANAHLNWAVNIGIPAANYQEKHLVDGFKAIAAGAMSLASAPEKVLAANVVRQHWDIGQGLVAAPKRGKRGAILMPTGAVDVVPEIAAQVHGFVQSTRFDPKARNIYMMVDIGAGTVDASIFHVRREAKGDQGFTCYGNTVEQNGVMNLHRSRIKWFRDEFEKINPPNVTTARELDKLEQPTDRLNEIPDSIKDYFSGVSLSFQRAEQNPDEVFFARQYWRQVFGNTLMDVRRRKLQVEELYNLPSFLVGGGARMNYYERLFRQINNNPNLRWARMDRVNLEIPPGLVAPGLRQSDFDRVSVAYGLSFVQLGTYMRAQEVPDLPAEKPKEYFDKYISKDQM